jgi:hypothetical protein
MIFVLTLCAVGCSGQAPERGEGAGKPEAQRGASRVDLGRRTALVIGNADYAEAPLKDLSVINLTFNQHLPMVAQGGALCRKSVLGKFPTSSGNAWNR